MLKSSLPQPDETNKSNPLLENQLNTHRSQVDSLLDSVKADLEKLEK